MPGAKKASPSGTPEIRRSNRVLIPKSQAAPSSVARGSRENIFIPKRNSFGIVIKPFDPMRRPSRSRSQSRSRSHSRERLDSLSRNGSRSSLGSTTSKGKIDKRKSMSLGDIDLEDEFVALDNEIYREQKRNKNDSRSSMRKLSRSPGREKSKEALVSSSSSNETGSFGDSRPMHLKRQRSIEFSVTEPPGHQNQSTNKQYRSESESTVEASFKLDQRKSIIVDDPNFNRNRARQHERIIIQNNEEAQGRSNAQPVQTSNPQRGRPDKKKPTKFISVPLQKQNERKDERGMQFVDSSDDGTDLDDQPWSRPTDALLCHPSSPQPTANERFTTRSYAPPIHSLMNDTSTYMNVDESQPMLSLTEAPELPPKSFVSPPPPLKRKPLQTSPFSHMENDRKVMQQMGPTVPPKNVTSSTFTGTSNSGSINNSFFSPRVPMTPNFDGISHVNAQICPHHQQTQQSCQFQNGHICGQNLCLSQTQMPHFHHEGCQNHTCAAGQCAPLANQNHQWSHWSAHNEFIGNVCDAQGIPPPHQNAQRMRGANRNADTNAQSAALLGAHRQFNSTVNLRSEGLARENENINFSKSPKMHKAKSTDVLTFEGTIKEDPEVENLETSGKMKKTKSTIILDDLSLSSERESLKPSKIKPKLSEDKKRGRMEMWSGLLQLLTICSCLLTTVPLAIMSKNWDWHADRCPLYVESNLQHDRLWGNPSMIPCYLSAYMPVVIMTIALCLLFVHGGLLFFWRSGRKSSSFYMKHSFSLSLLFFNLVSFCVAIAVACMLTDGLRQTCLSFQFISDIDYRPTNCQNGFNGLDLNYNIEGSFYYIIFGMIGAWLTVIFTLVSFCLCLARAKVCSCSVR